MKRILYYLELEDMVSFAKIADHRDQMLLVIQHHPSDYLSMATLNIGSNQTNHDCAGLNLGKRDK